MSKLKRNIVSDTGDKKIFNDDNSTKIVTIQSEFFSSVIIKIIDFHVED
jgi:hypothetical protein